MEAFIPNSTAGTAILPMLSAAPALALIARVKPEGIAALRADFPAFTAAIDAAAHPAAALLAGGNGASAAADPSHSSTSLLADLDKEEEKERARFQSRAAYCALQATFEECERTTLVLERRLSKRRIMAKWAEIATFVAGGSILSTVANLGALLEPVAKVASGSIAIAGGILGILSRKEGQLG